MVEWVLFRGALWLVAPGMRTGRADGEDMVESLTLKLLAALNFSKVVRCESV